MTVVKEKKQLREIEIIDEVRRRGHDVGLELWGAVHDHGHLRMRGELDASRPWLRFVVHMSRGESCKLPARSGFLLHLRQKFCGIVIAEVIRVGMVPLVSARGGHLEVVGAWTCLLFSDDQDASDSIAVLLGDRGALQATRRSLRATRWIGILIV